MDWQQLVTDFDGEPVFEERIIRGRIEVKTATVDGREEPAKLTLGRACINALINERQGDEQQTGAQRFDRSVLALKVNEDKPLTTEDVALIKERVGRQYRADVVYNIWTALEAGK